MNAPFFDQFKDPDAVLDYTWDWTPWLGEGETIDGVAWIVPDGIDSDTNTNTDTTATIWLSGGTVDVTYAITCRITTNQDRVDDRTINVSIREK